MTHSFSSLRPLMLMLVCLSLGGCPAIQTITNGINPFSEFLNMPGAPKDDGTKVGPEIEIEHLTIDAQGDANGGTPMWVYVAILYKNAPLDKVSTMDATTFYKQWQQLIRDNPQRMEVTPFQVVAGDHLEHDITMGGTKPIAGFIFAKYDNGTGPGRLALASGQHLRLVLKTSEPWYEVVQD